MDHTIEPANPGAAETAGIRARRIATRILHNLGSSSLPLALFTIMAIAVVDVVNDRVLHIDPQMPFAQFALYTLAIWGGAGILQEIVFSAAEMLDPDVTDGDTAEGAAQILRELREDIANGADPESVRHALTAANVGTALGDLTADLANFYELKGDHSSTDSLWEATEKLRSADWDIDGRK